MVFTYNNFIKKTMIFEFTIQMSQIEESIPSKRLQEEPLSIEEDVSSAIKRQKIVEEKEVKLQSNKIVSFEPIFLSDYSLIAGDVTFRVHKYQLCAVSSFFRTLFSKPESESSLDLFNGDEDMQQYCDNMRTLTSMVQMILKCIYQTSNPQNFIDLFKEANEDDLKRFVRKWGFDSIEVNLKKFQTKQFLQQVAPHSERNGQSFERLGVEKAKQTRSFYEQIDLWWCILDAQRNENSELIEEIISFMLEFTPFPFNFHGFMAVRNELSAKTFLTIVDYMRNRSVYVLDNFEENFKVCDCESSKKNNKTFAHDRPILLSLEAISVTCHSCGKYSQFRDHSVTPLFEKIKKLT